jgi:hypothetical protein
MTLSDAEEAQVVEFVKEHMQELKRRLRASSSLAPDIIELIEQEIDDRTHALLAVRKLLRNCQS